MFFQNEVSMSQFSQTMLVQNAFTISIAAAAARLKATGLQDGKYQKHRSPQVQELNK